jgi:protein-L-isoaspartate(D-aspartate) O-methyltransferase
MRFADERVIAAMEAVPRELFVSTGSEDRAYLDEALRIECGQTISQPYVVAYMTSKLDVRPEHRVLEIGTGSGYQTAVLARLARKVYSVERHEPLASLARTRLDSLDVSNVEIALGDGFRGWGEHAPFDRIIVTAAAKKTPSALIEQLEEDGCIIIPIGADIHTQRLMLGHKRDGRVRMISLIPVRFVPLVPDGDAT